MTAPGSSSFSPARQRGRCGPCGFGVIAGAASPDSVRLRRWFAGAGAAPGAGEAAAAGFAGSRVTSVVGDSVWSSRNATVPAAPVKNSSRGHCSDSMNIRNSPRLRIASRSARPASDRSTGGYTSR